MRSQFILPISGPIAPTVVLYGGVFCAIVYVIRKTFFSAKKLPLPPGPKGIPILGNVTDLPPKGLPEWEHWAKHKDIYGPISSITVFGQTIILLHDVDMAVELLDKRSAKFSSRPSMVFPKMCGYEHEMGILGYDRYHRKTRKLAAGQIGSAASIKQFHDLIDLQTRRFLLQTLENPDNLLENLQIQAASIILEILFGYNVNPNGRDPLVTLANKFMAEFGEAIVAGAWLVDMIPWLRFLPDWMPGAGFKKIAREYTQTYQDCMNIPYAFTENHRRYKTSYISKLLDTNPDEAEIELIKNSAASLYGGGADTTVASMGFFFLAMSLFPDIQIKAREEIDRVTGGFASRLPTLQDRPNLPYVEAVVKETMRWVPIAPLCVPHTSDEEDEFRGYRIPRGTLVIPSIAWFSQDPNTYSEPHLFKPERFLGPGPVERDPYTFVFGFGRRICPGRRLADASVFIALAQSLAVFDIKKPIDPKTGMPIERLVGATPGLVTHPTTYHFNITPRSEAHTALVKAVETEHPYGDLEDASLLRGNIKAYMSAERRASTEGVKGA
ncbi:hypothetical protein TWF225_001465 [Orbilia oligospora]|nr:hypothetical protein TWF225_001465 [Orbilia oligospora]KAF3267790.1 hypothetical protein TWF217_011525 [Orbilia oligospora]KAF3269503.1 hypothetical protein TWF128_005721 [Orbilia oligospora]KAF3296593.1 hypothetical protein TWF132_010182 [Orbilia oligospora]